MCITMYISGYHGGTKDEVINVFHSCEKGLCMDVCKSLKRRKEDCRRKELPALVCYI